MACFLVVGGATSDAFADGKPNSCGCYQDVAGACFCSKKAKCGCPGYCEPKGCEEKRQKEINKEIEAETRKAQNAGRRSTRAAADGRVASDDQRHDRESAREGKAKAPAQMTPGQRKELLRLLDLYTAEHGNGSGGRSLDQLRNELTPASP